MKTSLTDATSAKSPTFESHFILNELYYWVNVIFQLYSKADMSDFIYNKWQLLKGVPRKYPPVIITQSQFQKFTDEYLDLVVLIDSEEKVKIQLEVNTTFASDLNKGSSKSPASYLPLKLIWENTVELSKHNLYFLNLPGKPENIKFTNMGTKDLHLMLKKTNNQLKKFVSHFPPTIVQTVHEYEYPCTITVFCTGTGSLTQVEPHSNKFLRNVLSWNILISKCSANLHRDLQIPKHISCTKVNNTSLPMFTTHRDYTSSLWYQTNNIHTECKTPVKCLKYNHHTNYFNFSQHYYFVFDFNFYATQHFKQYSTPYSHQRSWIEASKLCRSAGGTLPIIRSREELDELISLLKYGSALPPIEILYLGFITDSKVSKKLVHT